MTEQEKRILDIVKEFNNLMRDGIEGPDCTNPSICSGECCSIEIGIPKALALAYITNNLATQEDFLRTDTFSFKLRFDEKTGKCFLFKKEINGCSIHFSGIKPPHCWIYPTGFTSSSQINKSCKKIGGWKIIHPEKTQGAEKLLKEYIKVSKEEAQIELKNIRQRIGNHDKAESRVVLENLKTKLKNISPNRLAGFKDTWSCLELLEAEGYTLQLKKICKKFSPNCAILNENFMECKAICEEISEVIISLLMQYLYDFMLEEGADPSGEYPFYKLFEFIKSKENSS